MVTNSAKSEKALYKLVKEKEIYKYVKKIGGEVVDNMNKKLRLVKPYRRFCFKII